MAAEQGDALTQLILGYKCEYGSGSARETRAEAARVWYRLAAEQGGHYGATQSRHHV